ncbi:hemolysin family protein [Candidatus Anaplasma sp. TIGMIC]|uniref:hemolysin family protein n=1 Tax=Candidatus Anaplasma sp. TIGMIC TaxID=3020713 RepID=UPI00232B6E88|nr:hemolysin family protein [Candidatus Anaplasma sp. TIGMIC]MDB1135484.1 hemolysin family protein [Candidatus Anaplasma sp. TIGMIC]
MGSQDSVEEGEESDRTFLSRLKSSFYGFILNKFPGFKGFIRREVFQSNTFCFNGIHIMNNLVSLDDCTVQQMMVQRSEIRAFALDDKDLLKNVLKSQHTRVPVYRDNLDNIVGFVHVRDVMRKGSGDFNVREVIHNVMYVPHSMKAVSLFVKMQTSRVHMAIVLDEYGSTDGLVTMEDIVEQIVGNIEYENDENSVPDIINISSDKIEVNARVLVRTLEQTLGIVLRDPSSEEEYDTIGGLIFSMVGRVPVVDEVFNHKSGAVFCIKEVDNRCIYRVVVDLSGVSRNSSC